MKSKIIIVLAVLANASLLFGSLGSNSVTSDEARQLPAGLAVWKTGAFSLADDSPPLSRIVAAFPALFFHTKFHTYDLKKTTIIIDTSLRKREEEFGAYFANENFVKYPELLRAARATGFLWWLLGAWVIGRWARELHGDAGMAFGIVLWCSGPNILACEQIATPALSSAVAFVFATDVLRRHLKHATWESALAAGFLLGIAQLVEFTSLILYIVWPVLVLILFQRWSRSLSHFKSTLQIASMAALIFLISVLIINLGYGFQGGDTLLGEYHFVSRALGAEAQTDGPPSGGESVGNRFRGSWPGRLLLPLPNDYIEGLDRRWHEMETADRPRSNGAMLSVHEARPLAMLAAKVPLGVWILVLGSLILTAVHRTGNVPWPEELTLWLPPLIILWVAAYGTHVLSPSHAIVMMAPFGVIIASKLACFIRPRHWRWGLPVMMLLLWSIGSSLLTYPYPRAYLNEAVGDPVDIVSRMRYGPFDGGPDLAALKDWLRKHPTVRLQGMAIQDPLGPRVSGLRFLQPPIDPGPTIAGDPSYTRRTGPYPGYYAVDPLHLKKSTYLYFSYLVPMANIGSSTFIYHISQEDADRVRLDMGLPKLDRRGDIDTGTSGGLLYRTFVDSQKNRSHYALFVPPEYHGDRRYPLILFLHGWGDRGTTGRQYTAIGLLPSLAFQGNGFGFFVLCPQGESGTWRSSGADARRVLELLDAVQKEYRIDANRIYLSGVSSGAVGVWDLAAAFPERWAAIVPVATGFCNSEQAPLIKNISCWCFHNIYDRPYRVDNPRRMIHALQAAGGTPKYTEFFGVDHNAWDRAYAMPELYDWLIRQVSPNQ